MTRSLKHRVSSILEVTWGTTPATPAMDSLECSTASGAIIAPTQQAATVRNDGNIKSSVPMNRSGSFARTQELVFPTVNEGLWKEIRAGLRATEAAQISSGTNGVTSTDVLAITVGGNTITRGVGSFVTDGYQPGDVIELTNGPAADNGFYPVRTVAALTLTLDAAVSWSASDADVDIRRGTRMVNGTTEYSFSIEEAFLDVQEMVRWTGQRVSSLAFGLQMGSKSTLAIAFVGKDGINEAMASATVGITGATYTAYTEAPVLSPRDAIDVDIAGVRVPCRSLSITIDNGARVRHSTSGGATPDAVPTGATRVRLSMSIYAATLAQLGAHRLSTSQAVMVRMASPDGKSIAFNLGAVTWDTGTLPMSGVDQDAMIALAGTATLVPAVDANDQDWTLRFFRFV